MSSVSEAGTAGTWRRSGGCGRMGWTPVELLAMVLGFMVYWPIGLGIIAWKFVQKRGAVGPDWLAGLRETVIGQPSARTGRPWSSFGGTGNSAFDTWRKQEIERLEEERRKLEAAQAEFAAFVEEARRSRDKDEFERFMAGRSGQA